MTDKLLTDTLIPTQSEFTLERTERTNKSAFTSASQVISSPTGLWTVKLKFENVRQADAKKLIATMLSMRGAIGKFLLFDWSAPKADGHGGVYGVIDESKALPGMASMTSSLPMTKIASAGDYVSINNELKALVDDVVTDNAGKADVIFEPFMRTPIDAGTKFNFDKPTGVFRLKPGYKVPRSTSKKLVVADISIDCVEAVTI